MKKLALFFTAVFLVGATVNAKTTNALEASSSVNNFNRGYGNSFIFTEGGIEFSVFPDGQFDFYAPDYGPDVNVSINTPNASFSFNSGYDYSPYLQYDDFGAIIQIENTPIYYDYFGRVTQVGNVDINYNDYGRVARVGELYVHYNSHRVFTHYTGYINVYNRAYVYRPWHIYYAVPAPSFCIVYARPYRQYYTPVRYHYYRPYTNNYRAPVRYTYHNNGRNNGSGRRGTVASTGRASDRYRQEASPSRSNAVTTRGNSRDVSSNNARNNTRSTTNSTRSNETVRNFSGRNTTRTNNDSRPTNTTRSNETVRNSNNRGSTTTRTNQGTRAASSDKNSRATTKTNQGTRAVSSDRNTRATTQKSISQNNRSQASQRKNVNRNTTAVSNNTRNVKSLPKGKPQASNTRISNTKQQQRSTSQKSSSQRTSKQPSSRTKSKRGNG